MAAPGVAAVNDEPEMERTVTMVQELWHDTLLYAARGDRIAVKALSRSLRAQSGPHADDLARLSPATLADIAMALGPKRARALLRRLDDGGLLAVLAALDPRVAGRLLDPDLRQRALRAALDTEQVAAAEARAGVPEALREEGLAADPAGRRLDLLPAFAPDSAGAIMRRRLVAAPGDWTVAQLVEEIRAQADLIDKLHAAYVIDDAHRLAGYLKIRDLLLSPANARLGDIARSDAVAVRTSTDREDVLKLAKRARLKVLPVLDDNDRLVGMVTTEELRRIERAEAEEDMKIMAGLDPEADPADGPLRILRRRLPWLAGGLFGASVAAVVVGSYEDALTEAAILATLIPIVMSLAGNAGIQASTVTVQAMTSGNLLPGEMAGRSVRELGGALLNGASVGLIVALGIMGVSLVTEIDRPAALALTAAATLIAVTVQASVVGSMIPVLLDRLRFDPAVATGVFITTSNDVVGVLIFFLIATGLYL